MKKDIFLFTMVISALLLTQCTNRKSEKLVGVWKLVEMDVNGTNMSGASLGGWLWEFNAEGGYLVDIAGVKEKGWYKLNNDQLTLQITTAPNRLQTIYTVARLDSAQLVVGANTGNNKSSLSFARMKGVGVVDKD